MRKLIFGLLTLTSYIWGQNTGQNVVNVRVIASQTITTTTSFISAPLQNIGQSSHIFKIIIGAQTVGYNAQASIQGSIDGVSYFNIGPVQVRSGIVTAPLTITCTGTQSYPFIRTNVLITLLAPGSVTLIGNYTGNSSPAIVQSDLTNTIGGMIYTTSGTLTLPITTNNFPITPVTATQQDVLYGFDLIVPSTATSFSLQCDDGTTVIIAGSLPGAWYHLQMPLEIRPFGACPLGSLVELTIAGTGTANYLAIHRYE